MIEEIVWAWNNTLDDAHRFILIITIIFSVYFIYKTIELFINKIKEPEKEAKE